MPKARPAAKTLDAISLLKADHRKVEKLFAEFEKARGRKAEIARQICLELLVHMIIEDEVFYPACAGIVDKDKLNEAYVEHDSARMMIAEIEAGSPADTFFSAKVKVLSEEIEHHVKEEEEPGGIFAQMKKSKADLEALGAKLQARKDALMREMDEDPLPTPVSLTLSGAEVTHGRMPA